MLRYVEPGVRFVIFTVSAPTSVFGGEDKNIFPFIKTSNQYLDTTAIVIEVDDIPVTMALFGARGAEKKMVQLKSL